MAKWMKDQIEAAKKEVASWPEWMKDAARFSTDKQGKPIGSQHDHQEVHHGPQ